MAMVFQQLVNWSHESSHPKEVTEGLEHMLHEIKEHIDHTQVTGDKKVHPSDQPLKKSASGLRSGVAKFQDNRELIKELTDAEEVFQRISKAEIEVLGELPEETLLGKVDDFKDLIRDNNP